MRTMQYIVALLFTLCCSSVKAFAPSFGVRSVVSHKTSLLVGDNTLDDIEPQLLVEAFGWGKLRKMRRKLDRRAKLKAKAEEEAAAKEERRAAHAAATEANAKKAAGKALKLIIAGAPASGKGTQCAIIKENYGVVHLSTGDMLRAAVAAGTEVGKQAKDFMDAGKLVPDDVIIGVVADRLSQADCESNGWLLDGFPRTQAQAQALADAGISADCFIFLEVPDEVLVERVVGRRTDPETGDIYHMKFSPPQDAEVMARVVQRSDDTEEKVKVRLEQFHANVEAVKGSYTDISVSIDGTQSPADVSTAIANAIESKVNA